jgi:hypothetical protein
MIGLVSPRLYEIYRAAEKGDSAGFAALERYRMEALDVRDFLDAILLSLQLEAERDDHTRALRVAELGLGRARQAKMSGEIAVLAANVAYYKAFDLTRLEIEHESNLQFTRVSGFPFQSVADINAAEKPLLALRREIEELLREARAAALDSGNLRAINITMVRQAMTLSQRHWAAALRAKVEGDQAAADFVARLKDQMQVAYEAAIRAARAMNDETALATAYGNLANDLHAFGDDVLARQHALHALELAKRSGYVQQVTKTTLLLEKMGPPR